MGLQLITAPDEEPVSLSLAKAHLRVTHDDEDELITQYIASARRWLEEYTRRAFITQEWELTLERFPITAPFEIVLPWGKARAINDISYTDSAGNPQTLSGPSSSPAGTDWQEDLSSDEGGRIRPPSDSDWPQTEDHNIAAVTVNYDVGLAALSVDVPDSLKTAVLYRLTDLYEYRGDVDGNGTASAKDQAAHYRLQKW
jgi:uncharacterized phiE125 gp8 family phage protein